MSKRMVTRSITAPMVYMENAPKGIHMPGTTLRAAEVLASNMGSGNVTKVVMETLVYELEEDIFLQYAHIRQPKVKEEEKTE